MELEKLIKEQKKNIKKELSSLIKEEPFFLVYLIIREKGKLEFRLKTRDLGIIPDRKSALLVNVLIDKLRNKIRKKTKVKSFRI